MTNFNVEAVMQEIRTEISEKEFCTTQLSYVTSYYRRLVEKLRKKESIVLFGAGTYGKALWQDLKLCGIETVECFCDNGKELSGTKIGDMNVLTLKEALQKYPDACYVITPRDYQDEILHQLMENGLAAEQIITANIKNTGLVIE